MHGLRIDRPKETRHSKTERIKNYGKPKEPRPKKNRKTHAIRKPTLLSAHAHDNVPAKYPYQNLRQNHAKPYVYDWNCPENYQIQ